MTSVRALTLHFKIIIFHLKVVGVRHLYTEVVMLKIELETSFLCGLIILF